VAVEWGSVPDWIAAIGTSFAFVAALYVIFRDHQAQRRRQNEEDARQARLVLSWVDAFETAEVVATEHGLKPRHRFEVVIHNASSEPIIDCLAEVWIDTDEISKDIATSRVQRHKHIIPPGNYREAVQLAPDWATRAVASIAFTDGNGRRWLRNANNELSRGG